MCYRDMARLAQARWRWKPAQVDAGDSTTTDASHTANAPAGYVHVPAPSNQSAAHRRPKAVVTLVRSVGHRHGGRGVLSVAGLPSRSHPVGQVQNLVDGMLVTVLGIFVVVVLAAVWLARRRHRSVAAARSYDEYDEVRQCTTRYDDVR